MMGEEEVDRTGSKQRGQSSKATSESVDARASGPTLDLEITSTTTPPARAPQLRQKTRQARCSPSRRASNGHSLALDLPVSPLQCRCACLL